jgi:hypothetical protein
MNDEIRALLVRSREDVGLAEISRQGVGCLEKLSVKSNRLFRASKGNTCFGAT